MPFCSLNGCSIYIPTVNIPQIPTLVEHNKRQKCAKFQLSTTSSKDMAMHGVKKKVVNTPSYGSYYGICKMLMNLIIIIGKVNNFISSGNFFCLQMDNYLY